jgi:hypothetical protein
MNPTIFRAYVARLSAERGRPVGRAEAEAAILDSIRTVARGLGWICSFGYHTPEDIEQEVAALSLEVLAEDPPKYDPARPLENFLYVHVRNQLSNQRRKHYLRLERPCTCCEGDSPSSPCKKWRDWVRRNTAKQNLMRPVGMDYVADEGERAMAQQDDVADQAVSKEFLEQVERGLTPDLRADYLRMRAGVPVPKTRRQKVRGAVLAALQKDEE